VEHTLLLLVPLVPQGDQLERLELSLGQLGDQLERLDLSLELGEQ
jgi:hypothetical protein